LKEEFVGEIK